LKNQKSQICKKSQTSHHRPPNVTVLKISNFVSIFLLPSVKLSVNSITRKKGPRLASKQRQAHFEIFVVEINLKYISMKRGLKAVLKKEDKNLTKATASRVTRLTE
jgi:hypothetical protein